MEHDKNAQDAAPEATPAEVDYTANNGCVGNPITNFLLLEAATSPEAKPEGQA